MPPMTIGNWGIGGTLSGIRYRSTDALHLVTTQTSTAQVPRNPKPITAVDGYLFTRLICHYYLSLSGSAII